MFGYKHGAGNGEDCTKLCCTKIENFIMTELLSFTQKGCIMQDEMRF